MNGLELTALLLTVGWIAVLTLTAVLLVRQVALLTVRLDRIGEEGRPVGDGLAVRDEVPAEVARLLPSAGEEDPSFVLILGAVCNPCRELLEQMAGIVPESPICALIAGRSPAATSMMELVPDGISCVGGPDAAAAVDALHISTTPFVFEVRSNRIAAKAALRGAEHLVRFIGEAESVSTSDLWEGIDVHIQPTR